MTSLSAPLDDGFAAARSVSRWPTLLAWLGALVSVACTYLAWRAAIPARIIGLGIGGYLAGALGATIFWNVQRAFTNRAASRRQRVQPLLGLSPQTLAWVAMLLGLLSGAVAAYLIAAEVARR